MGVDLAVPAVGLLGLLLLSSYDDKGSSSSSGSKRDTGRHQETFQGAGGGGGLPNVDVPDKNYPPVLSSSSPLVGQNVSSVLATAGGGGGSRGSDLYAGSAYSDPGTDLTSKLMEDNAYYGNNAYTDKYFNQDLNVEMLQNNETSVLNDVYTSLTGQSVDSTYFRHNNMQPYFGSNIRGRNSVPNATESILDSYAGQGSQTLQKQAVPPLFTPSQLGFVYGAPDNTDFFQSRVNPSNRMANVKPVEEVQVGPGVGLGYTTCGQGGFNSGMLNRELWQEKGVDELRPLTNPKASEFLALGHEVPDSVIKSMGSHGTVNKNRVDTSFEMGEDRWLTTTGVEKGPTLHGAPVERYVSRPSTSVSYVGGPSVMNPKESSPGQFMPSKHQDLGPLPVGIVSAGDRGAATEEDYERKACRTYMNNRTANYTGDTYVGAVSGVNGIGAVVSPLLDMLRPTRKETLMVENNMRPYLQIQAKPAAVTAVVDRDDRKMLPPTIRETTERGGTQGHAIVQAGAYGVGGYSTTEVQPVHNQRETTNLSNYMGIASAGDGMRQARSYEAEYAQRNNEIKPLTIESRGANQGGMAVFNYGGGGEDNAWRKKKITDVLLENTREVQGSFPHTIPTVSSLGRPSESMLEIKESQKSQQAQDRFDPSVLLSQLKQNPYALDLHGLFGR